MTKRIRVRNMTMPALVAQGRTNLERWLPHYATAVGHPRSEAEYLMQVVEHNLQCARIQKERRAAGFTQSSREMFRTHLATALAAKQLLRTRVS